MNFEEFQHLARLYVVGALDAEDMGILEQGRREFGPKADECIAESRRLELAFALSLQLVEPAPGAKQRLLGLIQASGGVMVSKAERIRRTGKGRALHNAAESDLLD